MLAFVSVYHRRRAFVEIFLRGRGNAAIHRFGREHNARVAETLHAFADEAGLAGPDSPGPGPARRRGGRPGLPARLREVSDGDPVLIEEGIAWSPRTCERYATPAGIAGVRR